MKNNSSFGSVALIGLAIVAFVAYLSVFTVHQTRFALVLRFGEVRAKITEPGLHFKVPFIDKVEEFDNRVLDVDLPEQTLISADRKNLVVDAFLRYRIVDPLKYLQTTSNNETIATNLLSQYIASATLNVLANAPRELIVKTGRGRLMEDIQDAVNPRAVEIGVELIDLRLTRVNLPEVNLKEVYNRMREERIKEATEIEARGKQRAVEMVAEAQKDARIIVAEAEREAEQMRGEGDATHSRILADATGKNPEFYRFYRSLQAYEKSLVNSSTNWVLSPKSDFFNYMQGKNGQSSSETSQ